MNPLGGANSDFDTARLDVGSSQLLTGSLPAHGSVWSLRWVCAADGMWSWLRLPSRAMEDSAQFAGQSPVWGGHDGVAICRSCMLVEGMFLEHCAHNFF